MYSIFHKLYDYLRIRRAKLCFVFARPSSPLYLFKVIINRRVSNTLVRSTEYLITVCVIGVLYPIFLPEFPTDRTTAD